MVYEPFSTLTYPTNPYIPSFTRIKKASKIIVPEDAPHNSTPQGAPADHSSSSARHGINLAPITVRSAYRRTPSRVSCMIAAKTCGVSINPEA